MHKQFLDEKHVIRCTDRFWAGLSTDLAIEQVLLRSLKTSGGLTRGRGITEGNVLFGYFQCQLQLKWMLLCSSTQNQHTQQVNSTRKMVNQKLLKTIKMWKKLFHFWEATINLISISLLTKHSNRCNSRWKSECW